jgi:hypothetical protein
VLLVLAMTLLGARGDGLDSVSARQPGDSREGSAEGHRHGYRDSSAGPLIMMMFIHDHEWLSYKL